MYIYIIQIWYNQIRFFIVYEQVHTVITRWLRSKKVFCERRSVNMVNIL